MAARVQRTVTVPPGSTYSTVSAIAERSTRTDAAPRVHPRGQAIASASDRTAASSPYTFITHAIETKTAAIIKTTRKKLRARTWVNVRPPGRLAR
jgi:hypothetical protein